MPERKQPARKRVQLGLYEADKLVATVTEDGRVFSNGKYIGHVYFKK